MPTRIALITGESGSGKSHLFKQLATWPIQLVDADKRKKDWVSLTQMVNAAIETGQPVVLSITRGVSTYIKLRPDLQFRIYLVDATVDEIVAHRRERAGDPTKDVNVASITKRLKRLESIYRNYGTDNVRGSTDVIAAKLKEALNLAN